MAQEFRIHKVGALVRVQIVHGLMDTTQFTLTGSVAQVRAWLNSRSKKEHGLRAIIITDPYLAPSEILSPAMQMSRLFSWGVKDF